MAASFEPNITERSQVEMPSRRPNAKISRTSATVSFQPKPSVHSGSGIYSEDSSIGADDILTSPSSSSFSSSWYDCLQWLTKDKIARQGFRVVALTNLLILLFSVPFFQINEQNEFGLRIQFSIITCFDVVLSLMFTFHLLVKTCWYVSLKQTKDVRMFRCTDFVRLITLLGLSVFTWYSVAIGIYRSYAITIHWSYYIGFLPRAILSITSAVKLFLPSRIESSVLQKVSTILKWKQLCMVTILYFIFLTLFALIGVHIIGGLDSVCLYNNSQPSVPILHCDINSDNSFCPEIEGTLLKCGKLPLLANKSDAVSLNFRTYVYYGQFRTILDALYAVYEASTLELWNFMMFSAINGHYQNTVLIFLYYAILIFLIVILLQQSMFLVVIIESFADLRSHSHIVSSNQNTSERHQSPTKPTCVLSLKDESNTTLFLQSVKENNPKDFIHRYSKTLNKMEKVFLILVLADVIVTGTKRADFPADSQEVWRRTLQIWQLSVSFLFLVEVIILFLFHLYHSQWKLFFKRPYYIFLCILGIGGLVAAVPHYDFYDPLYPANALILFQSLRFPRLIRISRYLQDFFVKVLGNFRIPLLILITVAIMCFLAIINAQIFAYKPTKCPSIDNDNFSNIWSAFLATFQLVMNEAWTDVTSELMCGTGYEWIFTNLYFIIIHLFSSLIFLNFFGAVILDNLEYEETEKKIKLEEFRRKEASCAETVPLYLRIFKKLNNQPKKLHLPGLPDPNLEENEVKRFFEATPLTSVHNDYSVTPPTSQHTSPTKASESFKLTLVSDECEDIVMYNNTHGKNNNKKNNKNEQSSDFHWKFQSISSILKFVKLWRQNIEDTSTISTRSSHLPWDSIRATTSNNKKTKSEFDEFRENHRCFDQALFCMPPEHKLRKFCTFLITAQAESPKYVLIEPGSGGHIWKLFKERTIFVLKWVVSRMPYISWIMFLCLTITVIVQFGELSYIIEQKEEHYYILVTEVFYIGFMLSWLLIRILSKGLFLNPHAAISSVWDLLDWILVIDSIILLVLLPVWQKDLSLLHNTTVVLLPYSSYSLWTRILMIIRGLRPLHIISLFESFRSVIREILEGWKLLLTGIAIMVGFMLMFASLGVQLFAGTKNNPLAFCNDPSIRTQEECVGEFYITLKTTREFLNLPDVVGTNNYMLVPRVWFPYARDFPFNNVPHAILTLFELLTLEGWTEVRGLFSDKNNNKAELYMTFYVHIFVFLAVNLGLQILLGIIVNNFNEHKPDHRFLLSVDQNRWVELMQRLSLQRPYKLPPEPKHNSIRLKLYRTLTHSYYRVVPTVVTILSTLTLVVPWNNTSLEVEVLKILIWANIAINVYTIVEVVLKILAFGPTYFHSWRNLIDLFLAFVTFVYIICAIVYSITLNEELLKGVSVLALTIAILKCLTVLMKYSALLNLLITVGTTVLRTIPLIQVLYIIILSYSFLGAILFSEIKRGETLLFANVNYAGSFQALTMMLRSLTGEDWFQLMWDVALKEPYGSNLGNNHADILLSVLYFGSYVIIVPFTLLNVFIAVLLENFSIFYNDDDTKLDLSVIKNFKRNWRYFDTYAKGHIKLSRVKLLLRSLDLQKFYSYALDDPDIKEGRIPRNLTNDSLLLWEVEEELRREVSLPLSKTTPTNNLTNQPLMDVNVSFQNVLKMLAYRCEDINTRLESHDLYARQELETTIKIDVAEMCILKWMKKYVQPIVMQKRTVDGPPPLTPGPREGSLSKLYTLRHIQSTQILSSHPSAVWNKDTSVDGEDEDTTHDNHRTNFGACPVAISEEVKEGDQAIEDIMTRTYNKMLSSRDPEMSEAREKAKEWLQIQQDWMNHVGYNPNYFDDGL